METNTTDRRVSDVYYERSISPSIDASTSNRTLSTYGTVVLGEDVKNNPPLPSPSPTSPLISVMAKFKSFIYKNRGVFLLLVAEFLSSSMGITTRYLETSLPSGRKLHPFHIMWCRMSVTLLCSLVLGWYQGTQFFPFGRKEIRPLLILRSMGGFVGLSGFYCTPRLALSGFIVSY